MSEPVRHSAQKPYRLPSGSIRVILVRHGAAAVAHPDAEPLGLLDGHNDPPLAPSGREQADAVCARLALDRPDRVFVSSLRRTAETAAPLLAATGLESTVVPELREVHLGEWEGHFSHRVAGRGPIVTRIETDQRWDVIPGAEDTDDFRRRVAAGLDRVVGETEPGETAAVFVHGGVIAEICRLATGARPLAFLYSENTSLTRLAFLDDGSWMLRGFNDVGHLVGHT
jgi:probable phosphoglycerate mutase